MFNYMLDLELHFSNSVSFVPMLFDAKTMGVCTIHINQSKIKDGDHNFSYFYDIGDFVVALKNLRDLLKRNLGR